MKPDREEIIALAKRYQDALIGEGNELMGFEFSIDSIIKFYNIAYAAGQKDENSACAKVCKSLAEKAKDTRDTFGTFISGEMMQAYQYAEDAIRARSNDE